MRERFFVALRHFWGSMCRGKTDDKSPHLNSLLVTTYF